MKMVLRLLTYTPFVVLGILPEVLFNVGVYDPEWWFLVLPVIASFNLKEAIDEHLR
jgi:hypothetical protein